MFIYILIIFVMGILFLRKQSMVWNTRELSATTHRERVWRK